MIQANQRNLVQTSNVTVVGLRQAEVNYFTTFFSSFGTIAAILTSISINTLTNVIGLGLPTCGIGWIYLYWASTTLAFLSSMRLVIISAFLSVYGQGLALRGPLGSMVKSIEGMVSEQKSVVSGFNYAIFWSAMSITGMYWAIIPSQYTSTSIVITIMIAIGTGSWYRVTSRLYNRFSIQDATDFRFQRHRESGILEYNLRPNAYPRELLNSRSNKSRSNDSNSNKFSVPGLLSRFLLGSESETEDPLLDGKSSVHGDSEASGYVAVFIKGSWQRCFLVLRRRELWYYKNKEDATFKGGDSINKRPVALEGLSLVMDESTKEPPFDISLINEEDEPTLHLRFDTVAEASLWVELLQNSTRL